jgi:glycosyltransferase involved in cell wall biosynthesis
MKYQPKISCLCVTYKRLSSLVDAIHYFNEQTYPNKELVIVSHDDDVETREYVRLLSQPNLLYFEVPRQPLGDLRNLSIELATGEFFCQWDDDDWYHNRRLELQMQEIERTRKKANLLAYWIMFDKAREQAYLSFPLVFAGTILSHKDLYYQNGIRYPSIGRNEDTDFMYKVFQMNYSSPLINPSLYIYIYHGTNTWQGEHFELLFSRAQPLSPEVSLIVSEVLKRKHSHSEASALMTSDNILSELDYFRAWL